MAAASAVFGVVVLTQAGGNGSMTMLHCGDQPMHEMLVVAATWARLHEKGQSDRQTVKGGEGGRRRLDRGLSVALCSAGGGLPCCGAGRGEGVTAAAGPRHVRLLQPGARYDTNRAD